MLTEESHDQVGRFQPSLIGLPFILNHGRQCIQLAGKLAAHSLIAGLVYEAEKQGQPRFDRDKPPTLTEHASSFGENLVKVIRQSRQMMKTSLHDYEIL